MDDREINRFVGMKIKEFRKNKKLTQQDLADLVGVKNSAISNYEQGTRIPKRDFLFRVANALGVSIDEFFPIQSQEISATLSEITKVSSQLEEPRQQIVLDTANFQLDEQQKLIEKAKKREKKILSFSQGKIDFDKIANVFPYDPSKEGYAPVIGEIAAGTPILAEENFEGMRPVYGKYAGRNDVFWIRVRGESMETEIHDGSFALILQDPNLAEGSIGAVRFIDDNCATLKCVYYEYDENGSPLRLRLEPLNPDYPIQYADEYNPAEIEGRLVKVEQDY